MVYATQPKKPLASSWRNKNCTPYERPSPPFTSACATNGELDGLRTTSPSEVLRNTVVSRLMLRLSPNAPPNSKCVARADCSVGLPNEADKSAGWAACRYCPTAALNVTRDDSA